MKRMKTKKSAAVTQIASSLMGAAPSGPVTPSMSTPPPSMPSGSKMKSFGKRKSFRPFVILLVLLIPASVWAGDVKIGWTQPPESASPTDSLAIQLGKVQQYKYDIAIDGAIFANAPATCAIVNAEVQCTTPLTLTAGAHTFILRASNLFGSASSAPFGGAPPTQPTKTFIISGSLVKNDDGSWRIVINAAEDK